LKRPVLLGSLFLPQGPLSKGWPYLGRIAAARAGSSMGVHALAWACGLGAGSPVGPDAGGLVSGMGSFWDGWIFWKLWQFVIISRKL